MGGGKGGSGGGTQTVTQQADPWAGQQPYLKDIYAQAGGLPQQVPYPYPGVVPFAPTTAAAQIAQTNRAMQGSPLTGIGQRQIGATARGDYLHGGQGFDEALQAAHRQIAPMVRGQFEGAGRYGSGLQQATEMQMLGDVFARQYGDERQRQVGAAAMGPTMAAADYTDIAALGQVGAQQEARAGQALADTQSRWQFQQQAPYGQIGTQSQVIQGGYPGGMSRSDQPNPQTSPLAGAMAGGMLGYGASQLPYFSAGAAGTGAGAGGGAAFAPWLIPAGAALGYLGSK